MTQRCFSFEVYLSPVIPIFFKYILSLVKKKQKKSKIYHKELREVFK